MVSYNSTFLLHVTVFEFMTLGYQACYLQLDVLLWKFFDYYIIII